ncbi:MAG: restriction endonuclease [Chloroflexi bacterium]|nr:restriction endonuclease [Chloroflexota bacterium]
MPGNFFDSPVLNSPYGYPDRHWELDENNQPTQRVVENRRSASFYTPIPKPRRRRRRGRGAAQGRFVMDEGEGLSTSEQEYDLAAHVDEIRQQVDAWRRLPNSRDWGVTPETARLLDYWRNHDFANYRPFFCQVEAVETIIWLTEVAPNLGPTGRRILDRIENSSSEANGDLLRWALKMATGAGKTTVMAMIIAWQTINAVRHPQSSRFTRGFLIVAPGITIKDRLRVLQPNDLDNYYTTRELVPNDMRPDLNRASIVITNYHAFKLRERIQVSAVGRRLAQGKTGQPLETLETDGQMIQRVMCDLMGIKNILVLNDEGHHCYREKQSRDDEGDLKGDELQEGKKNSEAARLWINGLESVKKKLGIPRVIDLSATPFFLRGSGYAEGTLFPWTVSDFSLMDAIECGIVKLPRVPVADNIPGEEMPMYRNLWEHIGGSMPRAGRRSAGNLDPRQLPVQLQTALEALYGHYKNVSDEWERAGISIPPCFIVVCNNTSTSKLVYDYISGFEIELENGLIDTVPGKFDLFENFDEHGNRLPIPRTLLIDSEQLESGDALHGNFREAAASEIEQFRREIIARTNNPKEAEKITDEQLLREVMNTVGKEGRLGEQVRCVVSVSMLTEGWDANTVTHVLGVRAFGTQLLCEQVVGRALRRQSYDLNNDDRFDTEYADVLGVPFDFTAAPVIVKPQRVKPTVEVKAVRPDRDHLEIVFPRVNGYRVEMPSQNVSADFTEDSVLVLTPELIGATETRNEGIIGEGIDLDLVHTNDLRRSELIYRLTERLVATKWHDSDDVPMANQFFALRGIVRRWLDECLECQGGTYPAQLLYQVLSDMACERITAAITRSHIAEHPVRALLDPYTPSGSTRFVNFRTSSENRWEPKQKCHINWVILDSDWEGEFCRIVEGHPKVRAYVKNHNIGLEVPYKLGSISKKYIPDFIVQLDDGHEDPLNLMVEIKGYRGEDAKVKKETMETYWVPGVNRLGQFGRWTFAELTDFYLMSEHFEELIQSLTGATISEE